MTDFLSQYINLTWIYWFLTVAYAVTIISIIGVILSENRNPVKSLAWVTVLLALPAVGLVLYIIFGRNIKNTSIISRRNRRRLRRQEKRHKINYKTLPHSQGSNSLVRLSHNMAGAVYHPANRATLFNNGSDKMDALLNDIKKATSYINIQYYIIADDNIGNQLRDALIERACAGVKIRVIYDHVGCFRVKKAFFNSMRQAGIEVYPFFKVTFPGLGSRINWRNHRKIAVIDGRVGYIGGMNIADRYITGGNFPIWRDLHLRVEGDSVSALQNAFAIDWNYMGNDLLEQEIPPHDLDRSSPLNLGMQLVTAGPTGQWSNIAFIMLRAISQACKCIFIQTPYFIPTEGLLHALQTAALSHVDVRIMMPLRSDSDMLRWASNSYIRQCLQAGIKIYLFKPGMLHSKAMLIDDDFSTVGSTNFDFRSVEHNFESNMLIYSREFNARLREQFLADQSHCHRITMAEWKSRPLAQKTLESLMRLFSPIL